MIAAPSSSIPSAHEVAPMRRFVPLLALVSFLGLTARGDEQRPNVLFIAVDDLRPELGCYGVERTHSPNIDRLAARGTVFERAYCMVPTCGASRSSLMTSIRPSRNRFVNYLAWAEKDAPGITTLNTHFQVHGYHTASLGKVFHHPEDNAGGWTDPAWRPKGVPTYHLEASLAAQKANPKGRGPAWEAADVADDAYADGVLAQRAIGDLRRLSKGEQPFFLAVGFFKPHLPFVAPQRYWDLHDPSTIDLPETYHRPQDAPDEAIHSSGELRAYAGIPAKGPVSDDQARTMIRGYLACVSYTDAQIGRLLDEVDRLKIADNTIVVLWGDHGWNLGEHTLWCKHSCFETSMHAPLIVSAPGIAGGTKTAGLTEFIDVYPSLCELAGLPIPKHVQGTSFVELMREPQRKWKWAATGRFGNGDTIRSDLYRYTEYTKPDGTVVARMLYDHSVDPDEDVNIAERPELREELVFWPHRLRNRMGKDGDLPQ
jgi:iduronate 2-sulfatase